MPIDRGQCRPPDLDKGKRVSQHNKRENRAFARFFSVSVSGATPPSAVPLDPSRQRGTCTNHPSRLAAPRSWRTYTIHHTPSAAHPPLSMGKGDYFVPIVLADLSAARNDSRAISFMRPEKVRIFMESAKLLVNIFALYSICDGEIIKISLVISRESNCFIEFFIFSPALFSFLFLFIAFIALYHKVT